MLESIEQVRVRKGVAQLLKLRSGHIWFGSSNSGIYSGEATKDSRRYNSQELNQYGQYDHLDHSGTRYTFSDLSDTVNEGKPASIAVT